ncbi:MAG: hypothetical protein HWN81_02430 [Candidatus Lokiarchaeota archaeon]|nr:hypothetical protein [Candidatus Lokiarchaeota archaeon]
MVLEGILGMILYTFKLSGLYYLPSYGRRFIFFPIIGLIDFPIELIQLSLAFILLSILKKVNKNLQTKTLPRFYYLFLFAQIFSLVSKISYIIFICNLGFNIFIEYSLCLFFSGIDYAILLVGWFNLREFFIFKKEIFQEKYSYHGKGSAIFALYGTIMTLLGLLLALLQIGIYLLFIGMIIYAIAFFRFGYFISFEEIQE